jgi:hypothetical protein
MENFRHAETTPRAEKAQNGLACLCVQWRIHTLRTRIQTGPCGNLRRATAFT